MTDWHVEYRDLQNKGIVVHSRHSNKRELAIHLACDLMRHNYTVIRVVGRSGEVVDLPEIKRHYEALLTAGKLI
jgi:transcription initiation factor TFIIIB Brf1 subunit/transcription initiation factor TFIIB